MHTAQKVGARNLNWLKASRVILPVVSVSAALIAIFPLATWAETATWHHGFQHVLIFTGGAGMGASIFMHRQLKEDR